MKLPLLLASAAVIAAPAQRPAPPPAAAPAATPAPAPAPVPAPPPARLPGFAAELAQAAPISSPAGWAVIPETDAWAALAVTSGTGRQAMRWTIARGMIARGRGAEAMGLLDLMAEDDPDLAMVDSWRLARGAAATLMGRPEDAMRDLASGNLAGNAEACAWRLRAAMDADAPAEAMALVGCARPAILARGPTERGPFLIAAGHAAVESGKPALALQWLKPLADRDPAANLYRGRAQGLLGMASEARLRLARVEESGTAAERADARLSEIEIQSANGWSSPADTIRKLDAFRYRWRGDAIEERALRLAYRLAAQSGDMAAALHEGATLYRFYDPAREGPDFVPALQAMLSAAVDPATGLPLDKAAGLFWDYRDLIPGGAEGDLMVSKLAGRLQTAGLYEKAAELYEHQLFVRATDLTQGPLSVKVATLYILAGRPDRAVVAIRQSAATAYPAPLLFERKRVEAVALSKLGRAQEAFAVLQDVPGAAAIRAEIAWKKQDWAVVAAETKSQLPPAPGALNDVDQAIVLRRAIALAMLRQEDDLAALHARYAGAFARLPNGPVFAALTTVPGSTDPAAFAKAMASLPSASPVGALADLMDAGQ